MLQFEFNGHTSDEYGIIVTQIEENDNLISRSPILGDNNTSDWIRTTTNGLIPVQSGGRGSGHSALGTDSWYFSKAYVDHVYSTDVKIADKVTLQYDSTNTCLNFVFS